MKERERLRREELQAALAEFDVRCCSCFLSVLLYIILSFLSKIWFPTTSLIFLKSVLHFTCLSQARESKLALEALKAFLAKVNGGRLFRSGFGLVAEFVSLPRHHRRKARKAHSVW